MAYNDMGDDDLILAGDDMGRRRGRRGRSRNVQRPIGAARRAALQMYQADNAALPTDLAMPFDEGSFDLTHPTLSLNAQPQREFQVRRLVIELGRDGTTATGAVRVTNLDIGVDRVFTNNGRLPVSMFANNTVGIHIKPTAARPGIVCNLGLIVTPAPGGTDSILVSAGAAGPSLS
jgi:hypothetical protein